MGFVDTRSLTQSPNRGLISVRTMHFKAWESIASDNVYMPYSIADEVTGALQLVHS